MIRKSGRLRSSSDDAPIDYLINDSLDLPDEDRPSAADFLDEHPREARARLPFLLCGAALSSCNVLGAYEERAYAPLVVACVGLGLTNAVLDATDPRGVVEGNVRRGIADPKVLRLYAGTYSAAVCWLALRVYPPACPSWLPSLDPVVGTATSALFVASLVAPLLSLLSDGAPGDSLLEDTQLGLVRLARGDPTIRELPPFTPTEKYRTGGLLAIGFVACLYLPVSSYLAVYGDAWWSASLEKYPQQGLLEASTALFGLNAVQWNVLLTRAGGYGVRPVGEIVKLGVGVCLLFTVVPCASALYFLQDGTTFFDHYQYLPQ